MVFVIFIPFLKFSLSSYCISYSQCDKQLVFFIRRLGILKKKKKIIVKNLKIWYFYEMRKRREGETSVSYTFVKVCCKKQLGHWMGKILDGHVAYLVLFVCMICIRISTFHSWLARVWFKRACQPPRFTWIVESHVKKVSAHFNFVVCWDDDTSWNWHRNNGTAGSLRDKLYHGRSFAFLMFFSLFWMLCNSYVRRSSNMFA